ncbi:DUF397 domain-containing protein [Streptomyces tsukubensis]|uniref:DUF397 domain-containing protein n=1 Tax=Streptomyces tsukubensis TaxID=83656 RepID=UPI0036863465
MTDTNQQPLTEALGRAVWRKSFRSGSGEGQCVEIADLTATPYSSVGVRDSKNPGGPALVLESSAFTNFIAQARGGRTIC